jgi:hypothetical protein
VEPDLVSELVAHGPEEVLVPLDFEIRVETALHENSSSAELNRLPDFLENHFMRKDIAFLTLGGTVEITKTTVFGAEVRVVDIPVDLITDDRFGVEALTEGIGVGAQGEKVRGFEPF